MGTRLLEHALDSVPRRSRRARERGRRGTATPLSEGEGEREEGDDVSSWAEALGVAREAAVAAVCHGQRC